jgi:hypothetical protein
VVFGARTQEPQLVEAVLQPVRNTQNLLLNRLTFFHPDFTVGSGISPGHAPGGNCPSALAGFTAGRDFGRPLSAHHPAPKVIIQFSSAIIVKYITKCGGAAVMNRTSL